MNEEFCEKQVPQCPKRATETVNLKYGINSLPFTVPQQFYPKLMGHSGWLGSTKKRIPVG